MMEDCPLGREPLRALPINTLGRKGCSKITSASKQRGIEVSVSPQQKVHQKCRRDFCNTKDISRTLKGKSDSGCNELLNNKCLRSNEPEFNYSNHCLFCGKPNRYNGKKDRYKLISVQKLSFGNHLLQICDERCDQWSDKVRSRVEFVTDLLAACTVYHKICDSNFRSRKQMPSCFSGVSVSICGTKTGRPKDQIRNEAFLKVVKYLECNDEEQTTMADLTQKMKEFLHGTECEAYGFTYLKEQLQVHFGDQLVIAEINGKPNVVTFTRQATTLLSEFYHQPRRGDSESEKMRVISTAAELIKSDIKAIKQQNDEYPTSLDMSSVTAALSFLPDSLKLLLRTLFVGKETDLKVASIGQVIMQATRPRVLQCPLLLGLGVQMSHNFGSRFLIDTLHSHGFSCSYTDVQSYRKSAAVASGTSIPGFVPGQFIQYVADNVDHNICTLDGKGTFHGMGIIATVTPKTNQALVIQRVTVSADDISKVGRINIRYFMSACGGMQSFLYEKLPEATRGNLSRNVDLLWKISLTVRSQRPSWTGMMQLVNHGEHPGPGTVVFLPMIDLNPNDLTCIYSTLNFVCDHARRYNVTPVLTFDQPLWWKALTIIKSEAENSKLRSIVLRLGGFHTLMSFLGCIGHLMTGTGLNELLELVFANNTTAHMMNGKAVARSVRGHLLVDAALNAILTSQAFEMDVLPINNTDVSLQKELVEVGVLYNGLIDGSFTLADVESSKVLDDVGAKIQTMKDSMTERRTSNLWFQYMVMIDIVRAFLRSERSGDWLLQLQVLRNMLPFMAACGHNLYTKSLHIYLQQMRELPTEHPEVYSKFVKGLHVVRRSDRFWAGLSTDLVIEQVLMRSLKTSGGLTRGRGMTELQRLVWVMSSHICGEVNNALQQLTGVTYSNNDQHRDMENSRQTRDLTDTKKMVEFLSERNPFQSGESSLYSIATGMEAKDDVNIDTAKAVGDKILSKMAGERVITYTFRKKDQAVTMDGKFTMKTANGDINIDPQVLFNRLVIAATQAERLADAMCFELCAYPTALLESRHALLPANKLALASAVWDLLPLDINGPDGDVKFVLDGGALLQRIPWQLGETYDVILYRYASYVSKRYGQPVVVFDGYKDGPSTKDGTHKRRGEGNQGMKVSFTSSMSLCIKKEEFLKNKENKQRFINMLGNRLQQGGCKVVHARGDADVLIARAAVEVTSKSDTVLVGDDTDLLVLLCFHHKISAPFKLFFMPEPKKGSLLPRKYLNISALIEKLGESICERLLFAHAILGCDTTSRLFGIGKARGLKLLRDNEIFCQQATVFMNSTSTPTEITAAGETALVCLYKGKLTDTLNSLRYTRFQEKIVTGKVSVNPQSLPPTSAAAKYHSFRVFQQVQDWIGIKLNPLEWGWKAIEGRMTPIHSDLDAAPEYLIKLVRCSCRGGCAGKKCGCRSIGLWCTIACSECRGICSNTEDIEDD